MRQMLVQAQLQIEATAVMNEFCWAYTNALVQKLEKLKEEDRLSEQEQDIFRLTNLTESIIAKLIEQTGYNAGFIFNYKDKEEVIRYIAPLLTFAREFLQIFEVPKN